MFDIVKKLEAPSLSSSSKLNHFSQLSQENVDKALSLAAVKLTTSLLDLCPSWLVKARENGVQSLWER